MKTWPKPMSYTVGWQWIDPVKAGGGGHFKGHLFLIMHINSLLKMHFLHFETLQLLSETLEMVKLKILVDLVTHRGQSRDLVRPLAVNTMNVGSNGVRGDVGMLPNLVECLSEQFFDVSAHALCVVSFSS